MTNFWHFDAGTILSTAAVLISFWGAHASNKRRIQAEAERMQSIESKVALMYGWFERNVFGKWNDQGGK